MPNSVPVEAYSLPLCLRRKKITYLGPHATGLISAFRVFHATVMEFEEGCESFRDVSEQLEAKQPVHPQYHSIPVSVASVQRACARTEEFFQQHWGLPSRPELFRRTGRGKSFSDVTPLGKDAWVLVHKYLGKMGAI